MDTDSTSKFWTRAVYSRSLHIWEAQLIFLRLGVFRSPPPFFKQCKFLVPLQESCLVKVCIFMLQYTPEGEEVFLTGCTLLGLFLCSCKPPNSLFTESVICTCAEAVATSALMAAKSDGSWFEGKCITQQYFLRN